MKIIPSKVSVQIDDLPAEQYRALKKLLPHLPMRLVSNRLMWRPEEARALYDDLAKNQQHLLRSVIHVGEGTLDVETYRGMHGGTSLSGLTSPITKAVTRLKRQGQIAPDLVRVLRTHYDRDAPTVPQAFVMEADVLAVFSQVVPKPLLKKSA